jgi:hypothetical protein
MAPAHDPDLPGRRPADDDLCTEDTPPGAPDQRRLDERTADNDRTLAAMHQLERALSQAAFHRQRAWQLDVTKALEVLDNATCEELTNADQPDSLLSDIARTQPRLRHRVHGLRTQYRNVRDTITALRRELDAREHDLDVGDVRQRLAWLLTALHYQRARESDLIYEAYFDAFDRYPTDDQPDPPASDTPDAP